MCGAKRQTLFLLDFTSTKAKEGTPICRPGDHSLSVPFLPYWQCVAPAIKIKQLQRPFLQSERVWGWGRFIWYIWQRPNGIPMEQPTKSYVGGGGGGAVEERSCGRLTAVVPYSPFHKLQHIYERASGERTFGGKLSVNYKYKHNALSSG